MMRIDFNMRAKNLIHPGEILREEFMKPLNISQNALAIAIRVPVTRIGEIVNEKRRITADTALRLGVFFNTTSEFWMNLQSNYDLQTALIGKETEIKSIQSSTKLVY